jgi:membrane protease YdiL (CAAX protease family)
MVAVKRFAARYPIGVGVIWAVALLVALVVFTALAMSLLPESEGQETVALTLARVATALAIIALLWRLGWLRAAGVARVGTWQVWLVTVAATAYEIVIALWAFFGSLRLDGVASLDALSLPVAGLAAGIVEELVFRGAILYAFVRVWGNSRRGLFQSALLSAVLFGGLHAINALFGKALPLALLQVLNATLGAVLYAALVLKGGSVWPIVFWHAALNTVVNLQVAATPGFEETIPGNLLIVLSGLPLLAYGLFLLWRMPLREVVPDIP